MPDSLKRTGPYLLGFACVGAATASRAVLDEFIPGLVPFATFFPALAAAGYFGGFAGAAIATVGSILCSWYFFLPPVYSFSPLNAANLFNLAFFAASGGLTAVIGALLRERVQRSERIEGRLRLAQTAGGVADWEWNVDTNAVVWSDSFLELLGHKPGSVPQGAATLYKAMHPDDHDRMHATLAEAANGLGQFETEFRITRTDGALRWFSTRAETVRDVNGMRRMRGVVIDITKRKEAELQREMVFHELNHRVKNNFQLVSSMLRMQATRMTDPVARDHLNGAVQRVMTIADVHSALYQGGHIDTLDLGDYLTGLCRKLQNSILLTSPIRMEMHTEPAVIKVDRAIPIGLVVNELVTNAVKHAFPEGRSGRINVTLTRHDHSCVLTVADDGVGMPDIVSKGGLGMRMVEAFVQQAEGSMKIVRDRGTCFHITLPDLEQADRKPVAANAA